MILAIAHKYETGGGGSGMYQAVDENRNVHATYTHSKSSYGKEIAKKQVEAFIYGYKYKALEADNAN